MAIHSSILAWRIPWTEEPVGCCPWGRTESDTTEATQHACIGEGNGNPLQCFCLENPRDRGAWWAAIYGVTQSDMTEVTQQQQQSLLIALGFFVSLFVFLAEL